MIDVRQLQFAYGDAPVLRDVSFQVEEGQFAALLGANGAGKSTLFKCMLGLLTGYEGDICIDGRNVRDMTRRELAGQIAYVPQQETQIYNYSVMDTVIMGMAHRIGAFASPSAEMIAEAEKTLEMLGIRELKDRGINEVSGGERQMALLARALVQKARILVLDEPTANLDYGNQHQVMRLIRSLAADGYTILLSTHTPEHALMYATHVLALKDGSICAAGTGRDVLTEDLIEDLYGIRVSILQEPSGRGGRGCIPTDIV